MIKALSLDRSLRSSELLKMWMNVFERLERDSIPESFAANLMITLRRLKRALDTHRGELEEWMLEMGFPKVIIEDNNETSTLSSITVYNPFVYSLHVN